MVWKSNVPGIYESDTSSPSVQQVSSPFKLGLRRLLQESNDKTGGKSIIKTEGSTISLTLL